jgi:Ni/Co efflux regulator RcnB
MKRMLMAIMAVAVAVTFSAPAFAGDEKTEKKDEKKGGQVLVYGDEKTEKKDEKKGGHSGTFEEKKDEKKKDEKGK